MVWKGLDPSPHDLLKFRSSVEIFQVRVPSSPVFDRVIQRNRLLQMSQALFYLTFHDTVILQGFLGDLRFR